MLLSKTLTMNDTLLLDRIDAAVRPTCWLTRTLAGDDRYAAARLTCPMLLERLDATARPSCWLTRIRLTRIRSIDLKVLSKSARFLWKIATIQ